MAGMQSFDVTSGCDLQEVDNAVNQAMKEINQRYDFKGLKVAVDFLRAESKLVLHAPDDFKLRAMWDVLQQKMVRRHVPVRNMKQGRVLPASGGSVTQEIDLQQGIPGETARAIVKFIKMQKMRRVQSEIQADQVRVSSPSRDELQKVIALLKEQDYGIELMFGNYRGQSP
jgi:cyclic-di-GMP-binding protein